jgi:hypothetical protein
MPGAELNILLAVAAGLLSFLSPCVLPLLPSYLSFIAGLSFEELQGTVANPRTRRAILANSLLFVLGFSIVFIALGAGATLVGQALFQHQVLIRRIGGAFVVLMGLYVAGWLRIPFLMREWRAELSSRPAARPSGGVFSWPPVVPPDRDIRQGRPCPGQRLAPAAPRQDPPLQNTETGPYLSRLRSMANSQSGVRENASRLSTAK